MLNRLLDDCFLSEFQSEVIEVEEENGLYWHALRETIFFYEGGGERILNLLQDAPSSVAVLIGPEGGFEPDEVTLAQHAGAVCATLGPRILRTETAPIAALAAIMQATGNL